MSTAHDPAVADRYISFKGIDYDGNVARVLAHLDRRRTGSDAQAARLIDYIDRQRASTQGARRDDLLLLHSLVNPIRELFERHADTLALDDLDRLERECF
ncbi:N(2)-fixation sustaining protein CowN [Ideonella sp. B508-1]|uniref:N(2)-fixation sustaining protein CowN n=1 Tax=Ideonella sp. B508-1 TaxID=137716 RepID=UPI0003450AF1|nr:N(2)-fixation sustaining protein CowN [Ideonella sp. B508-1]